MTSDKPIRKKKNETLEEMTKRLNTTYGGVYMGNQTKPQEYHAIGIPVVDDWLGGGLPYERLIELYGPTQVAKSALCYRIAATFDTTFWIDADGGYSEERARAFGCDPSHIIVQRPETLYAACGLMIEASQCKDTLIVVDSVAALALPQYAQGHTHLDTVAPVSPLARLLNYTLPIINNNLVGTRSIVILVNQVRDKIEKMGFGKQYNKPGGKQKDSLCTYRIGMARLRKHSSKALNGVYGLELVLQLEKNKLGPSWTNIVLDYYTNESFASVAERTQVKQRLLEAAGTQDEEELVTTVTSVDVVDAEYTEISEDE